MKLYYIEKKWYFRTVSGYEYQAADGGEMPLLFRTEKEAMERVLKIRQDLIEKHRFEEIISFETYPNKSDDRIWASRLCSANMEDRYELRVYVLEI